MSNKRLNNEWENKLGELVQYTEKEIANSLNEIAALGLNIDDKFGKMFVKIVGNRLSETYDKFSIGVAMSTSNQNESNQNAVQWPSTSSSNGMRSSSKLWQIELEKQRQLITGISIDGIPIQDGEDVRALFIQLCKHINFNISHKDLNDVHRMTNNSIYVDLNTIGQKRNIFRAWRQASLSLSTFFGRKLSSSVHPNRISISDAKTPYYTMLCKVAQNAVDDRIFDNCEIRMNGLEITYNNGRKKIVITSLSELDDLMNRYSKR